MLIYDASLADDCGPEARSDDEALIDVRRRWRREKLAS